MPAAATRGRQGLVCGHPSAAVSRILILFLPLVSSAEVPQGLFQRDAPVGDVSLAHRQSGADAVQTHRLWVLALLQEGGLWLQQPRDGVEPGDGDHHAVPSPAAGPGGWTCRRWPRQAAVSVHRRWMWPFPHSASSSLGAGAVPVARSSWALEPSSLRLLGTGGRPDPANGVHLVSSFTKIHSYFLYAFHVAGPIPRQAFLNYFTVFSFPSIWVCPFL